MGKLSSSKNHYIPKFYTKQWAGDDGLLCQVGLYGQHVSAKRRSPEAVGFKYDLYTIPGVPPEISTYIEDRFLKIADQEAADAHAVLVAGHINEMTAKNRNGWTRFIMTLFQRTPEKVVWLAQVWAASHAEAMIAAEVELRKRGDHDEADKIKNGVEPTSVLVSGAKLLQGMMDLPNLGSFILGMRWRTLVLDRARRLITSDHPVVISNGLGGPEGHLVIAVSPTRLFFAANSQEFLNNLASIPANTLVEKYNDLVVSQASQYVYAEDDTQIKFITNRLGRHPSQFIAPPDLLARFPRP